MMSIIDVSNRFEPYAAGQLQGIDRPEQDRDRRIDRLHRGREPIAIDRR